jgi:transposase-like protein
MSILSKPYFHDEAAALEKLESLIWPNGPVCGKCGATEKQYRIKSDKARLGTIKCGVCRKQHRVTVGTVFESAHIPLHKWLQAAFLLASSKKGISSNQLARTLEITVKSAWFMTHRLREAMRAGGLAPMGGVGEIVEVDETFIGRDKTKKPKGQRKGRGYAHKHKVLTLVQRGGRARSMVVDDLKAKTIVPILRANIVQETQIMTDEAGQYRYLKQDFPHDFVSHGQGQYGRGEIHTNTIEGYFSIFKRGMKGIYQHCGKKHLHRYLAEFDFRYNERHVSDAERADAVISAVIGKRLIGMPRVPLTPP